MIRRILVPLDGTAFSEYAIPFAVALARRAPATLELVHVHVPKLHDGAAAVTPFSYENAPDYAVIEDDEEFDGEVAWLEARAHALRAETGLPVVAYTVTGDPGETLCEEVAALSADLVVMATHARGGIERVRLGSIADIVVRHATAPVLLVHPPNGEATPPVDPQFRRMLIPLDGSTFSEQVLIHARDLARVTGAQPWLLHVVSPFPPASRRGSLSEAGAIERQHQTGEEYLASIAHAISPVTGAVLTTTVVDRRPAAAICDAASDPNVDIIAIATHGRGGISRWLLGSTGDEVMRSTHKPVLLFRPRVNDLLRDVFEVYGTRTDGESTAEGISLR